MLGRSNRAGRSIWGISLLLYGRGHVYIGRNITVAVQRIVGSRPISHLGILACKFKGPSVVFTKSGGVTHLYIKIRAGYGGSPTFYLHRKALKVVRALGTHRDKSLHGIGA